MIKQQKTRRNSLTALDCIFIIDLIRINVYLSNVENTFFKTTTTFDYFNPFSVYFPETAPRDIFPLCGCGKESCVKLCELLLSFVHVSPVLCWTGFP